MSCSAQANKQRSEPQDMRALARETEELSRAYYSLLVSLETRRSFTDRNERLVSRLSTS